MLERVGRYGAFYYCPNQSNCGQKTLTKVSVESCSEYFRTSAVRTYQERQSKLSSEEKKAEHYWKGEAMMDDIEFGELGGGCD